ncbi:MAG TPA: carboxypeptidase regulatory-like domain-containing protein, partial [Gemmatimonadales bacterium]|nr:carboxypeptidase regulatory-like domain-containing protein [Gemmatimonadales bacterium]
MTPPYPCASLLLLAVAAGALHAQTPARAPGGTLNGVVRDSATRGPVGYALIQVVGTDQRVFASESGRFTLTGLVSGLAALRVQQIGFRAVTLSLQVNAAPESGAGAPGLEVILTRRAVVLPEIVVHGDVCTGSEALGTSPMEETILDEAFKNAERILAMEKSYPFRGAFQQTLVPLDGAQREAGDRWVDTLVF